MSNSDLATSSTGCHSNWPMPGVMFPFGSNGDLFYETKRSMCPTNLISGGIAASSGQTSVTGIGASSAGGTLQDFMSYGLLPFRSSVSYEPFQPSAIGYTCSGDRGGVNSISGLGQINEHSAHLSTRCSPTPGRDAGGAYPNRANHNLQGNNDTANGSIDNSISPHYPNGIPSSTNEKSQITRTPCGMTGTRGCLGSDSWSYAHTHSMPHQTSFPDALSSRAHMDIGTASTSPSSAAIAPITSAVSSTTAVTTSCNLSMSNRIIGGGLASGHSSDDRYDKSSLSTYPLRELAINVGVNGLSTGETFSTYPTHLTGYMRPENLLTGLGPSIHTAAAAAAMLGELGDPEYGNSLLPDTDISGGPGAAARTARSAGRVIMSSEHGLLKMRSPVCGNTEDNAPNGRYSKELDSSRYKKRRLGGTGGLSCYADDVDNFSKPGLGDASRFAEKTNQLTRSQRQSTINDRVTRCGPKNLKTTNNLENNSFPNLLPGFDYGTGSPSYGKSSLSASGTPVHWRPQCECVLACLSHCRSLTFKIPVFYSRFV